MKLCGVIAALWLGCGLSCGPLPEEIPSSRIDDVDFGTEIIPVLTKQGCNAGACHGAATGRGNFRLSLFGSRPDDDFQAIVHHLEGRRVHNAEPLQSLLLQKPLGAVDHGGGVRFAERDVACQLLLRWIQQGLQPPRSQNLKELAIRIDSLPARQLHVTAIFESGDRDVTDLTTFTAEDPGSLRIHANGLLEILRPGRHVVIARYLNQVRPIEIVEPENSGLEESIDSGLAPHQMVDALIRNRMRSLGITAAPLISDPAWVRRLSLDLTGRLPSRSLLIQEQLDRGKLIDEYLASEEFLDFWSFQLARMLQLDSIGSSDAAQASRQWIRTQIEMQTPLSDVVRTMLNAEGRPSDYGPAAFYLVRSDARAQAEYVSETLAGFRLRCANCHDHPLDRWTQDDYHGLAAVFADISRGEQIRRTGRGSVIHPGTGLPAIRSIPGHSSSPRDSASENDDGRAPVDTNQIADWLLDPSAAIFAENFVNRVWAILNGRGIAHPVDDLRITNPPIHGEVLKKLAKDFIQSDYQLRPLIRTICLTETYARADSQEPALQSIPGAFAASQRKPLMAEVFLDAICDVTGIPERYEGLSPGTRAIQLFTIRQESESLKLLRQSEADTTVILGLLNGPILNDRLTHPESFAAQIAGSSDDIEAQIRKIYVRILLREPTPPELTFWTQQFTRAGGNNELRGIIEDCIWSLMVSPEFLR